MAKVPTYYIVRNIHTADEIEEKRKFYESVGVRVVTIDGMNNEKDMKNGLLNIVKNHLT